MLSYQRVRELLQKSPQMGFSQLQLAFLQQLANLIPDGGEIDLNNAVQSGQLFAGGDQFGTKNIAAAFILFAQGGGPQGTIRGDMVSGSRSVESFANLDPGYAFGAINDGGSALEDIYYQEQKQRRSIQYLQPNPSKSAKNSYAEVLEEAALARGMVTNKIAEENANAEYEWDKKHYRYRSSVGG
ncbi:MAG: hypothetical protein KIT27_07075 [Legionellales bacterium]|nr:hypothetical protein [Legionellales bacterium]